MCRQFRIKNLLVAAATFGLGVFAASLISFALSGRYEEVQTATIYRESENVQTQTIRRGSEQCITVPDRSLIHTERGQMIEEKIHLAEHKLLKVMRRSGIYHRKPERELQSLQRRLESELRMLLAEREILIGKGHAGAKLVYRQLCYEN